MSVTTKYPPMWCCGCEDGFIYGRKPIVITCECRCHDTYKLVNRVVA